MANRVEIGVELKVLTATLPPPHGIKMDKAFDGYAQALSGFTAEEIRSGIARFLAGEYPGISMKFFPRAPELASIIRGAAAAVAATQPAVAGRRRAVMYRRPESKIILANCTKQFAWAMIESGKQPRGSIWCPGGLTDRPEIGDLYGPDPAWRGVVTMGGAPVGQKPAVAAEAQRRLVLDYDEFVKPFPPRDRRYVDE